MRIRYCADGFVVSKAGVTWARFFLISILLPLAFCWFSCGGENKSKVVDSGVDSGEPPDTETNTETETETVPDAGSEEEAWLLQIGGNLTDSVCDVAVTDTGAVFVYGSFDGTLVLGEGAGETTLVSEGYADLFLAGFAPDKSLLWARVVSGAGTELCGDMSILENGEVLVGGGFFGGNITIGSDSDLVTLSPSSSGQEMFLAAFSSSGSLLWTRKLASDMYSMANPHLTAAPEGDGFYVAGSFAGAVVFGAGEILETTLTSTPDTSVGDGPTDVYVARYELDGTLVWAKRLTTGEFPKIVVGVAANADAAVYVAGTIENPVVFGEGEESEVQLIGTQPYDAFVAKVSGSGDFEWARKPYGPLGEEPGGVGTLSDGSVVIAGRFSTTITFGLGTPTATNLDDAGGGDIFVASYATNGDLIWAARGGGSYDSGLGDTMYGLRVLEGDIIAIAGYFKGLAIFGPEDDTTVLTGAGGAGENMYAVLYSADGSLLDAWWGGGSLDDSGVSIASSGESYFVAGEFQGMAELSGPCAEEWLTAEGPQDIFVGRYSTPPQ